MLIEKQPSGIYKITAKGAGMTFAVYSPHRFTAIASMLKQITYWRSLENYGI